MPMTRSHSFLYLVNEVFKGKPVSGLLLDADPREFISAEDHVTEGFRKLENVSYPCFTTARGHRVELREGVWNGSAYQQNLKLINVPVLKHHDTGRFGNHRRPQALLWACLHERRPQRDAALLGPWGNLRQNDRFGAAARASCHRRHLGFPQSAQGLSREKHLPRQPDPGQPGPGGIGLLGGQECPLSL